MGLDDKNGGEVKDQKKFLGEYELIRRLAVGGMAEIFLAKKRGMHGFEKKVVLKKIHPHNAKNSEFVTMFLDEARLAARLHHANVAQVYDIGCEDGQYYFTMEHVHGEDTRNLVRYAFRHKEPIDIDLVLTIVRDVAAGLHNAHEETGPKGKPLGIVHRDVSLSNIIVSFDGCVKVVDFGVAKAARRESKTKAGTLKGKVGYMSPEQVGGKSLDRRSDVFALGIVMYELLAAKRLYRGKTPVIAAQKIVNDPAPTQIDNRPDVPDCVLEVLTKALAKNPDERFKTARAFQVAIEKAASQAGLTLSNAELGDHMQDIFSEKMTFTRLMDKEQLTEDSLVISQVQSSAPLDQRPVASEAGHKEATQSLKRMALGTESPVYEDGNDVELRAPITSLTSTPNHKPKVVLWGCGVLVVMLLGLGFGLKSNASSSLDQNEPTGVESVSDAVTELPEAKRSATETKAVAAAENKPPSISAATPKVQASKSSAKKTHSKKARKQKAKRVKKNKAKSSPSVQPKTKSSGWNSDSALPPM